MPPKKSLESGGKKPCKRECPPGSICNETTGRCNKVKTTTRKQAVYHPFYKEDIDVDSEKNCGEDRLSIRWHAPNVQLVEKGLCDILPLKDINYVLGPKTYREYRYYHKNICIFGESHVLKNSSHCENNHKTVTFSNFLTTLLLEKQDVFFDFFVEIPYVGKTNPLRSRVVSSNFSLYLIGEQFHDCLSYIKNCPFENLRAHYLDLRSVIYPEHMAIGQAAWAGKSNPIGDRDAILKIVLDLIHTDKTLQKELNKSYLKTEILDYTLEAIQRAEDEIGIFAAVMDMYALSRIFRSFAPSASKPSEVDNIIIYTGNYHSYMYAHFIEAKLGITPTIVSHSDSSCLDFKSFKRNSALFSS